MRIPVIDPDGCSDCDACVDLCPKVFRRNDLGRIEVVDLSEYLEEEVDEIIKNCPGDCIAWEKVSEEIQANPKSKRQ
jgi:ferredoxin